jgi:metal-sulfur cluster biosynthetic enzyme
MATEGTAPATPSPERLRDELRAVVDPCTAATGSNLDIVEMGLLREVEVSDGAVRVAMRLTTPACHMVPYFITEIEDRLEPLSGVETVTVDTDDGMQWGPEMMSETATAKRRAVLDAYDADTGGDGADADTGGE